MSVKSFYKAHIDTIEKSLLSLDFDDVNLFVDLIINCKGKIFFTGVGKNGHVAAKATSTFSSIGVPCFYLNPVDSICKKIWQQDMECCKVRTFIHR